MGSHMEIPDQKAAVCPCPPDLCMLCNTGMGMSQCHTMWTRDGTLVHNREEACRPKATLLLGCLPAPTVL